MDKPQDDEMEVVRQRFVTRRDVEAVIRSARFAQKNDRGSNEAIHRDR